MAPPADISALVQAIDNLTTQIAHLILLWNQSDTAKNENNFGIFKDPVPSVAVELPTSLTSMPDIEIIDVNAPQLYVRFRCQVCLQEWIVPIPLEKLGSYQPPKWCRWCNSTVWGNPQRAQARSDQRAKRAQAATPSR